MLFGIGANTAYPSTVFVVSTPISIHQRSYETEAFDEGDGTMRVVGRLVDTKPQGLGLADGEPLVIHDMTIEMIVRADTFAIEAIDLRMDVHPYELCPGVIASYGSLVGSSISRGYSRRVKELFGGPQGCSHLGALLIALGPVAIQASWGFVQLKTDLTSRLEIEDDPEEMDRRIRLNTDTCHVWRSDGEQITQLRRGETASRPDWEIERLTKLGLLEA